MRIERLTPNDIVTRLVPLIQARMPDDGHIEKIDLSNYEVKRVYRDVTHTFTLGAYLPIVEDNTPASDAADANLDLDSDSDSDTDSNSDLDPDFAVLQHGRKASMKQRPYQVYLTTIDDKHYRIFDPAKDSRNPISSPGNPVPPDPYIGDVLEAYKDSHGAIADDEILLIPLIQCRGFFKSPLRREHYVLVAIVHQAYYVLDSQGSLKALAYPDRHKEIAEDNALRYKSTFFSNYIAYDRQTDHDSCGVFVLEAIDHILAGDIDITASKSVIETQCKKWLVQKQIELSPFRKEPT